jgi:hypothetical protein
VPPKPSNRSERGMGVMPTSPTDTMNRGNTAARSTLTSGKVMITGSGQNGHPSYRVRRARVIIAATFLNARLSSGYPDCNHPAFHRN